MFMAGLFGWIGAEPYPERFYDRYMSGDEFVMFDTEATGVNVWMDDIVQIAAVKVVKGKKIEGSDFNILIDSHKKLPKILGDKVNPMIKFFDEHPHLPKDEGLKTFIDYAGNDPIMAHNVNFDYNILKYNVRRVLGTHVRYEAWDSLKLIRCVEPHRTSYKLATLITELGLTGANTHMADDDVEVLLSLVDYCVRKIERTRMKK